MGRALANRLISGSLVAANLGGPISQECHKTSRGILCTPCEIQPTSEYQIRPLVPLQPAQQCGVWEEAVRTADGKVVTYKQVKALVAELIGPAPSATTPKKSKKTQNPFPIAPTGFSGRTTSRSSVSMRSNGMRRYRGGK